MKDNNSPVSLDEFRQLKKGYESLRNENQELYNQMSVIADQITPDEELITENRNLSDTLNGMMYDNQLYKNQLSEMQVLLHKVQSELKELKNTP